MGRDSDPVLGGVVGCLWRGRRLSATFPCLAGWAFPDQGARLGVEGEALYPSPVDGVGRPWRRLRSGVGCRGGGSSGGSHGARGRSSLFGYWLVALAVQAA